MALQYDLFDIVAQAIMLAEPVVIVEGKDDYQIYSQIAKLINKKLGIYQSNQFENYSEGCVGVIKCLEALQPKFDERPDNIRNILGIIDRDSRQYRNELRSDLKGLFITKYYSIETYFATRSNLKYLINKITFSTESEITEAILDKIEDEFHNSSDDLFLISLEALKNACINGYNAVVSYDEGESNINQIRSRSYIIERLSDKREELEEFARINILSKSDLKLIAKGKWYLYGFAYYSYNELKSLKDNCREARIDQCPSCKAGNHNDCLFKLKQNNYQTEILRDELLSNIDINECSDIIHVLNSLS